MRKLIYIALLAGIGAACGGKTTSEAIGIEDEDVIIADGPDDDTLCVYDGKTIIHRYVDDPEDIESTVFSEITVYSRGKPIKECKVKKYSYSISGEGRSVKIAVGADTVRYDVETLPETIDPVKDLAGKGASEHRMRHAFKAGSEGRDCTFILSAYMPEKRPEYVNRLIAAISQRDIEMIFGDEEHRPDLMKEYLKLGKKPHAYQGLNTATATPEETGRYFARKFEKSYRKYFADELKEGWAPQEEYVLETAPVWNSEDGRLTTYRFYKYHYGGGAHGMMNEFYVTFDTTDGRILGYRDILGEEGMKKATGLLEKRLDERLSSEGHTADLGKEGEEDNNDRVLNEVYEGHVYPRPAVIRNGIVFTYQAYDKGSFAEGTLHMLVPSEISKK